MARSRKLTIFNQTVTTTVNGTAYGVGGWVRKMAVTLTGSAYGGTNPTFTVKVQHSHNGGTTWLDLVTMTAMIADGTETKFVSEDAGTTVIGGTVRAIVSAAGGTGGPTALLNVTIVVKD